MDDDASARKRKMSDAAYAASYFDQDNSILPTDNDSHLAEMRSECDRENQGSSLNCCKRHKSEVLTIHYCEDHRTSVQHVLYIDPKKTLANLRQRICGECQRSPNETTLWYRNEHRWEPFDQESLKISLYDLRLCNETLISVKQDKRNSTRDPPSAIPVSSVCTNSREEKSTHHRITITSPDNKRTLAIDYIPNSNLNEFKQIIKETFDIKAPVDDLLLYSEDTEVDHVDILKRVSTITVAVRSKPPRTPSPQTRNGRVGLVNLGNTCFMNSALQCLSHVPALTKYFRSASVQGPVASAYQKFIQHVWDGQEQVFDPREIKQTLSNYANRFSHFNQQDAREFLFILLNRLHEDLKNDEQQEDTIISHLFRTQIDTLFSCSNCEKVVRTPNQVHFIPISLKPKERILTILFMPINHANIQESIHVPVLKSGYIEHVVQNFVAQHPQVSFRQLKVLSSLTNEELPYKTALTDVPDRQLIVVEENGKIYSQQSNRDKNPRTILDCLSEFLASEPLDDPWYCNGKCQQETTATKYLELTVVPPVLVLQLERFTTTNGVRRKLETFIDYPLDGLDLNELLRTGDGKAIYDLVAVANHSGSIHGGHYVAYARQTDTNSWSCFSDSYVSSAQPNDIVSSDAYLLFYVQRMRKETIC